MRDLNVKEQLTSGFFELLLGYSLAQIIFFKTIARRLSKPLS